MKSLPTADAVAAESVAEDDGGRRGGVGVGEVEDAPKGAAGVLDVERFHGPNVTERHSKLPWRDWREK